jgi:hypothetical protein
MRFGLKASPHFGQVLAVAGDLAKIYSRAWTFRFFLAVVNGKGWIRRTQKSGPFPLMTASAQRHYVGEVERTSTDSGDRSLR